jgi:ornithine cyclodeaminase/alanine dehydrogenase-like protein (mu-crystallin family)
MAILIKDEQVRGLVTIKEAIAAIRDGYRDQGERPAYSAPRIRMHHEDRRVSVHPGGCYRLGVSGVFVHVERFTFQGGAQQYTHAGKRVYVVYDTETAELKAIIVGSPPLFDFEPLEDSFGTETPVTSAVGTDMMARKNCKVLGLYGTGRQARRHLITMCAIRPEIEEVRVYSRSADNRATFVQRMQPHVRARLTAKTGPEEVAREADLICLATGSNVPVLKGAWLTPGQHVTSIVASNKGVFQQGSVSQPRREFDDDVIRRADRIVATLKDQAIMDEQADLFQPVSEGLTSWDRIINLGELAAGKTVGRANDQEITLFKQNADQGVGYMALAKLIVEKAQAAGIGTPI